MRKIPVFIMAGIAAAGTAIFVLVPLSPAREICSSIEPWGDGKSSSVQLNRPMGLAWANGFLYVADTENGEIKKFARNGSLIARWPKFKRPVAIAATGDTLYVADFLTDRITRLRSDGTVIDQWGMSGTGEGAFDAPSGIAVDPDGNVYVADFYNHRIQKFTGDGKFLLQWGGKGRLSGRFRFPTEIAINDQGEVLVADAYNHRVQKFTPLGDSVSQWGGIGFGVSGQWPGWFRLAKALTVDPRGDIYVADAFNRRIQKFTGRGKLLGQLGASGSANQQLRYPAGVAADPNGRVYISDFFANRIWKVECGPSRNTTQTGQADAVWAPSQPDIHERA